MKDIALFLVGLFEGMKIPQRWLIILLVLIIASLGLAGYERLTGAFAFNRLEREVDILLKLQTMADAGIINHPELKQVYERISNDLSSLESREFGIPSMPVINIKNPVTFGKAISGAFIWIVVAIFGFVTEYGKTKRLSAMTFALVSTVLLIGMLFAWIGTIIPTFFNPWINYILFPAVQLGVLVLLTRKRKS
jgi:hypothetical protein